MTERLRAAIRLLYPDDMTPTARDLLTRIIEDETHEAATEEAVSVVQGEL